MSSTAFMGHPDVGSPAASSSAAQQMLKQLRHPHASTASSAASTSASSTSSSVGDSGTLPVGAAAQHAEHLRIYKLLISGGLAGGISRTLTAPIDRLKMILQVQESVKGMTLREGVAKMASEGTLRAYFKGNGANVIKIAPETAMKLALNDTFKQLMAKDPEHIRPLERMAAGGLAGAVAQFLLYPLDTIRTRMAICMSNQYHGILHAAYRIRRDEGVPAFYRGLVPSMIGILPYAGVDICLFELFKEQLLDHYHGQPPHLALLGIGMLSSSVAQVVSYPLALIRTRLQAQGTPGMPVKYRGMADVLYQTVRREGWRGLYKGLLPNIFKLAPAAGISWYIFEETKLWLGMDPRS